MSGTGFGGLPTFGNRTIDTVIRLKDGETNMLAGLIRDDERDVLDGVPGLSDLPIVGRLFGKTHKETQQTDIILTLTPHIVRVLDLNEADLRPFRLGREAPSTPALLESPVPAAPARAPAARSRRRRASARFCRSCRRSRRQRRRRLRRRRRRSSRSTRVTPPLEHGSSTPCGPSSGSAITAAS